MTASKKLMKSLEKAHRESCALRNTMKDEKDIRMAFHISLRISELLNDIGLNFRLRELE